MRTKNNPGQFDCYANAAPDEPYFMLLARDKHAPTLIWLWASLRELDGENPDKISEARDCVVQMMTWARAHNRSCVGLGQATLAGVLELIRTVNGAVKEPMNKATTVEVIRRYLSETGFEAEVPKQPQLYSVKKCHLSEHNDESTPIPADADWCLVSLVK